MRRIVKVILGFFLIVVGLVLSIPGVPGPGLALVVLGLVLLSKHFHWARRVLEWGKRKIQGWRGQGSQESEARSQKSEAGREGTQGPFEGQ